MTLLEELCQLAEQLGLGVYDPDGTTGTIYSPVLPPEPDTAIGIARYGNAESSLADDYDEPGIQFRIRADSGLEAEDLAERVYDAFHGLRGLTLPGGTWLQLAVCTQSGPAYLGPDQSGRPEYAVNVRIEVSRPSTHRST